MRAVTITVDLPDEVATEVEELHVVDRPFLSRVLLYGITRRSIYRHLRERSQEDARRHAKVLEEATSRERAILRENGS